MRLPRLLKNKVEAMAEDRISSGAWFLRRAAAPLGGVLVATLLLSACAEREPILPGTREPVSAVLTTVDADDAATRPGNEARAIQLPPQEANAEAAQGFGTPAFRTAHPQLRANLSQVWSTRIGEGDSRKHRIVADPIVASGRIFTLDAMTTVSAVSPSGAILWQRNLAPNDRDEGAATGGGLAAADGVLYVSTGFGAVTALDIETGGTIWAQDLGGTGSGRPTVFGDLVYVMADDSVGWAIRATDGRIAWQVEGADSITNVLGAPAPVVTDELAVFAFGSGELQGVFRQGGLRRWDATVLGERPGRALSNFDDVTGRPIAADGVIYAGNQAGRTVALNAGSGARIWTANEGAIDTVLPVGGSVFLISDRNVLMRLDASDGSTIWEVDLPNFVSKRPRQQTDVYAHNGPILAGGRIIVASSDGTLRSFDPVSGALVGAVDVPSGASTAPVVAGQTLYLITSKGDLVAYR